MSSQQGQVGLRRVIRDRIPPQRSGNSTEEKAKALKYILGSSGIGLGVSRYFKMPEIKNSLNNSKFYKYIEGPQGIAEIPVKIDKSKILEYFGPAATIGKAALIFLLFYLGGKFLKAGLIAIKKALGKNLDENDLKKAEKLENLLNGTGVIASIGTMAAESFSLEKVVKGRYDLSGLEGSDYSEYVISSIVSKIKEYINYKLSVVSNKVSGFVNALYSFADWAYRGLSSLGFPGALSIYMLAESIFFIINYYTAKKCGKDRWNSVKYGLEKSFLYTALKYMAYPVVWCLERIKTPLKKLKDKIW